VPGEDLGPLLARAVDRGVDFVQIREKDLGGRALEALVRQTLERARAGQTRVLVNERLDVALTAGADGVHLPAQGLPIAAVRRKAPRRFLVGVSTHSLEEAKRAEAEGADLMVFGPVFETTSKPGAPALGLDRLAEVVRQVKTPVYALGGVGPEQVRAVADAGAAGVAGISTFLTAETLARLLAAIRELKEA
jgi:thiamine-phosphate pyrophosphorylase